MQRILFVICFFLHTVLTNAQSAAINNDGSNADGSAILDVKSTNKGFLLPRMTTAQRTAIVFPAKGLKVFDTDTNCFWFHNGTAWVEIGSDKNQWLQSTNHIYNANSGNVGIGTNAPVNKLSVVHDGTGLLVKSTAGYSNIDIDAYNTEPHLRFFSNGIRKWNLLNTSVHNPHSFAIQEEGIGYRFYISGGTGFVGIGVVNPGYRLHTTVGFFENRVGIGTAPTSLYALDVDGALSRFRDDVRVDGSLTVNNGKGVAYNANSGSNLRIFQFTTATFNAVLAGHAISSEGEIIFNGGFTSNPRVFVGDIDVTGGSAGTLYMVQLQLYGCTTTGGVTTCKARLINNSANAVNYSITWNCIAIGN